MTEQEWLASKDPIAMLDWVMQLHFRPSDRKLRLVACACSRLDARGKNHLEAIEAVETHADGHDIDLNPHSNWTIASPEYSPARMLSYLLTDAGFVGKGKQIADVLRDIIGNPFQPATLPLGEKCRKCKGKGDLPAGPGGAVVGRKERLPCGRCKGTGHRPSPVLTPLVLQLAEAAYTVRTGTGTLDNDALAVLSDALEEAGLPERVTCERCSGSGALTVEATPNSISYWQGNVTTELGCGYCGGESVENWRNGSGRQPNPILAHLREIGPHYRGCWATDILLGKE